MILISMMMEVWDLHKVANIGAEGLPRGLNPFPSSIIIQPCRQTVEDPQGPPPEEGAGHPGDAALRSRGQ